MELYSEVSYRISSLLTKRYSTSFSISTRLFPAELRKHIYAIYGLVRVADEIVDTYKGSDSKKLLEQFKLDTYESIQRSYSTNPIIHSFARTAAQYDIGTSLLDPFFASMAMDLKEVTFTQKLYKEYIYGSAEVVGLMCLKVFCGNDKELYTRLEKGASALGAAYQKVNFLRDIKSDYKELGRIYFPGVTFNAFSTSDKRDIEADIQKDFALGLIAMRDLPSSSRLPVRVSYRYYSELLNRIKLSSVEDIKTKRVRLSTATKTRLLASTLLKRGT